MHAHATAARIGKKDLSVCIEGPIHLSVKLTVSRMDVQVSSSLKGEIFRVKKENGYTYLAKGFQKSSLTQKLRTLKYCSG